MNTLLSLKNDLSQNANVAFALVFGSAARGALKPQSDLDLAVFFHHPLQGLELLDFIHRLSELGREVDLVVLNTAPAFLRHQILKKCLRLLIKDQGAYQRFREKTLDDYEEYKYISGMDKYDRPRAA